MPGGTLREVAALFLRLGLTAFGGPAAHIAVVEEECVRRRGWLSREQFLDVLGASNLIPGPTSTELVMHVGYRCAGWAGLVVAGVCFIVPAALIVGVLAALYVGAGRLPAFEEVLRVVKPVALVVVLQALTGLARAGLATWRALGTAVVAVVAALAGWSEVLVLLGAGALQFLPRRPGVLGAAAALSVPAVAVAAGPAALSFSGLAGAAALFGYFVKAGAVIFGSGYVLFAVLRTDLVEGLRWITEAQLLDAIAVGQITPGPVFTSATFIGYLLHGAAGAALATVGIFLPAFVCSALSVQVLHHVRGSRSAQRFLEGVHAAAIALIAVTSLSLARAGVTDVTTTVIAVLAAVGIGLLRWNSAWVLAAAALAGLGLQAL